MRVRLGGTVVNNDAAAIYRRWGYSDLCCPNDIRDALANCPPDEELILELNSGGGSVYMGFEMYTLIRSSGRAVTAEVQSIAGSAMSVVMAACTNVLMSPVGNVMIHRASTWTEGNSEDHRKAKQMLDTIDASILNAYTDKAAGKTTRNQFAVMMKKETFMTAQEAIDCGLADGMLESGQSDVDPMNIAASAYGAEDLARAMCALPPVEDLLTMERDYQKAAGEPSAEQQNTEECEKPMEATDIKTKEELLAAYPELAAQLQADAQADERERIAAIDGVALPGFEAIIAAAKADPAQNAGSVAVAIIAEQKKQGDKYLAGAALDAIGSGANSVPAADAPEDAGEQSPEDEAKADAKAAVSFFERGGKK